MGKQIVRRVLRAPALRAQKPSVFSSVLGVC